MGLRRIVTLAVVVLVNTSGCGPSTRASTTPSASADVEGAAASTTTAGRGGGTAGPSAMATAAPDAAGALALRFELEHPVMRASADPDVDVDARLDGVLYLVNGTDRPLEAKAVVPMFAGLHFSIVGAGGERFTPTFLPPPVPRPGDQEPRPFSLRPGEAVVFMRVHGVSGYRRSDGSDSTWYRVLPAGSYAVSLSGVRLVDGGELAPTAPVTLTVEAR